MTTIIDLVTLAIPGHLETPRPAVVLLQYPLNNS